MRKEEILKRKSIMVQGTASSVGKSMLCAALCRIFNQDGWQVNPFKSQNMSLNSYVTYEGHEMGRAQVLQAEAAGKAASSLMNPILLKPTSDRKSQVIIQGKVFANMDAEEYFAFKPQLRSMVKQIYHSLLNKSDVVVIEGAGSPAEINLKENDIVNMGMAEIAKSPVILVGDIDKGGVFASIVGTLMLLEEEERKKVKGVIINKFRGSKEILEPGLKMLEERIQIPVLGVIPYFHLNLEDEDSVTEWRKFHSEKKAEIDAVIIKLPRMSNFTDFNVLKEFEDINIRFVELGEKLLNPDLIILPGTKNTLGDMEALKQSNMAEQIIACHKNGSVVFGICGGFQMLGLEMQDPMQVESNLSSIQGLGLLNTVTVFEEQKVTTLSEGINMQWNQKIRGYEIHMGQTKLLDKTKPFVQITKVNGADEKRVDGAVNEENTVFGTYIHGIFDSTQFTRSFLNEIRARKGKEPLQNSLEDYWDYKETQLNQLADIVRNNLDMKKIYEIVEAGLNE